MAFSASPALATTMNWHTGQYNPSPLMFFNTYGNGNFSISVSGGNYFQGCDYTWGWCNQYFYYQAWTTGALIRSSVWGNMVGTYVFAHEYPGDGPEDTTLYAPYP